MSDMIQKLVNSLPLNGAKTYVSAIAYAIIALLQWYEKITPAQAVPASAVSVAGMVVGLAHKLAKRG